MQEYLRTLAIADDLYVALTPLAAWAANGEQTTRNLGDRAGYLKRELDLKRAIQRLRRRIWRLTGRSGRKDLLDGRALAAKPDVVADNLAKALILAPVTGAKAPIRHPQSIMRGLAIAMAGRTGTTIARYIDDQGKA